MFVFYERKNKLTEAAAELNSVMKKDHTTPLYHKKIKA